MKKNDIKAGVVYGFAEGTSDYRTAHPVIVLDAKTLWNWNRSSGRSEKTWKTTTSTRYQSSTGGWSSYWGPTGYLVLSGNRYANDDDTARNIEAMKTLYAEFAQTAGNPEAVAELAAKVSETEGVTLQAVNNRWIQGDYTETKNAEAERDRARTEQHRKEAERAHAEREFIAEVEAVLSDKLERKVHVGRNYGGFGGDVVLTFQDVAALLGIKTPRERL